jgi:hypothetical protein
MHGEPGRAIAGVLFVLVATVAPGWVNSCAVATPPPARGAAAPASACRESATLVSQTGRAECPPGARLRLHSEPGFAYALCECARDAARP